MSLVSPTRSCASKWETLIVWQDPPVSSLSSILRADLRHCACCQMHAEGLQDMTKEVVRRHSQAPDLLALTCPGRLGHTGRHAAPVEPSGGPASSMSSLHCTCSAASCSGDSPA